MSKPEKNSLSETKFAVRDEAAASELARLSAEIVDLLYTQSFARRGAEQTEEKVCEDFAEVLLRHWELCCIAVFLRGEQEHLSLCALKLHEHADDATARRVCALFAAEVERDSREKQVWMQGEATNFAVRPEYEVTAETRYELSKTELGAGVAVPIHARGELVGALVVLTRSPEPLRAAHKGLRFIAAPLVIALGNARRAAAVRQQSEHIEHLVEELQQRSSALEEANHELQRIGRYRSLFLARMSHELRTPLTSILGFAELLIDQEELTESQHRFCEKIQSSGLQLQSSLNQLVDLSRLESGQTELFLHEFSLRETLRESCAAVARMAQKQQVEVTCASAPELGAIVSDEGKLRHVLFNFLAYAISRSPAGGRVRVCAKTTEADLVVLEIADEGEPLADPTHLFESLDEEVPEERATNMNELGLSIAHRLVRALGGDVGLENGVLRGLTVRLQLPARPLDTTNASA